MFRKTLLAALCGFALAAPHAAAQDEAAAEEAASAESAAPAEGESVVRATHGDWEVRCARADGGCLMHQAIEGDSDNSLFFVDVIRLRNNPNGVAGLRVRAPIGVLLTRGLSIRIDGGQPVQAPFVFCMSDACVAEVVLREQDVNLFRRGARATLTVFAVQAPEQPQAGELSLMGFTRSFEDLSG